MVVELSFLAVSSPPNTKWNGKHCGQSWLHTTSNLFTSVFHHAVSETRKYTQQFQKQKTPTCKVPERRGSWHWLFLFRPKAAAWEGSAQQAEQDPQWSKGDTSFGRLLRNAVTTRELRKRPRPLKILRCCAETPQQQSRVSKVNIKNQNHSNYAALKRFSPKSVDQAGTDRCKLTTHIESIGL